MAFVNSNDYLVGRKPVPTSDGYGVVAVRFAIALAAADLALNAIGAVAILPARCVPVALYYDSDDLDTNASPAVSASVGVLNDAGTALSTAAADGGAVWGAAIATSQAGGQSAVMSKALSRVAPKDTDRKIGVTFTTAAATAAAGELGLTLLYRSV